MIKNLLLYCTMDDLRESSTHRLNQIGSYVGVICKARLKSAIVDRLLFQWLLFGLYVNRVQSTPAAQSEQ